MDGADDPYMAAPWTARTTQMAEYTLHDANRLAWIFGFMSAQARLMDIVIVISVGVLGCLLGTKGLLSVFSSFDVPRWLSVGEAVAGFCVGVLVLVSQTMGYKEVQIEGRSAHIVYAGIARRIMFQLSLPDAGRKSAAFVEQIANEIETQKMASPFIPAGAFRAYAERARRIPPNLSISVDDGAPRSFVAAAPPDLPSGPVSTGAMRGVGIRALEEMLAQFRRARASGRVAPRSDGGGVSLD